MFNKIPQKFSQLYSSGYFPWIIIIIGVSLRAARYLHGPSLWFDECNEAVNIYTQSLAELLRPSPNDDVITNYPAGYLILVKTAAILFGYSEYVLRLVPQMFGAASMILFYYAAKHYVRPQAVPVALILFATLAPLIIYSSTFKPYSSDIAFTVLLLLAIIPLQSKSFNMPWAFILGLLGSVVIWFSNSAVFVIAGIGTTLMIDSAGKKDWTRTRLLTVVFLMCALSFAAYYFAYHQLVLANLDVSIDEQLVMEHGYMPFPPKSLSDLKWFIDMFFEVFNNPVGFPMVISGLASLPFIIGSIAMFSGRRTAFLVLISPILYTLLATALHLYPFKDRLILFLVPIIVLFIAEGSAKVLDESKNSSSRTGLVFLSLLLLLPVLWAGYHAKKPFSVEEIKPVLKDIEENWQDGDILYVYYFSQYGFQYYTDIHPEPIRLDKDSVITGIAPRGWYRHWRKQEVSRYYNSENKKPQSNFEILSTYVKDLEKLKGHNRVWTLFSATIMKDGMQEEKFFLFNLQKMGKKLASYGRPGIASAYLFDLSEISPELSNPGTFR